MRRRKSTKTFYIVIEKKTEHSFIYKEKGLTASHIGLSRYKLEKLIKNNFTDLENHKLYVCTNAYIKSNSGGKR